MDYIEYDFYENPIPKSKEQEKKFHIRICNKQKLSTKSMVKALDKRSTFTPSDLLGSLIAFQDIIADGLGHGNIVTLDGICQFEITLGTKKGVVTGLENGNNVVLKSINIKPLPEFVEAVKAALVPRVKSHGYHSRKLSDIEVDGLLIEYFRDNKSITRLELEKLCGISRYKAAKIIGRLKDEGKIINEGYSNHPIYKPVPGNFGISRFKNEE